jgi:hypothetical protein
MTAQGEALGEGWWPDRKALKGRNNVRNAIGYLALSGLLDSCPAIAHHWPVLGVVRVNTAVYDCRPAHEEPAPDSTRVDL